MSKGTFWSNKLGKYVDELNADVPAEGPVKGTKRPALERWRKLSNAYYRYYNDGDAYGSRLHGMFKKYGIECPSCWESEKSKEEALEKLADRVFFDALVEKAAVEKAKEKEKAA